MAKSTCRLLGVVWTRLTSFGSTFVNDCHTVFHLIMPTILLNHAHGATVSHLGSSDADKATSGAIWSSTPLPIPSRFPSTSIAQTATSPSGHIFLWCDAVNIVWEYDARGRRVGEIVVKDGSIKRVMPAGKLDGKETAVVQCEKELSVWQKGSTAKWEITQELDVGPPSCKRHDMLM
jgi:hypothetical protein